MCHRDALKYFKIYGSQLQGCVNKRALAEGKHIHAQLLKNLVTPSMFLENILLNLYAKCRILDYSCHIFDRMESRNVFTWTTIISGYDYYGYGSEALQLYRRMEQEDVKPNVVTYVSVLSACTCLLAMGQGKQVHADVLKARYESNLVLSNTLIDMYMKCGSLEDSRLIFNFAKLRDVFTWTTLIAGYVQDENGAEALKLFKEMQQCGGIPNAVTFVNVLCACILVSSSQLGKWIHASSIQSGGKSDLYLGNAVVDMYAKFGDIEAALENFDRMPLRDVVSWNAVIAGYAQHGHGKEALELFDHMQYESVQPDEISFLSVLFACSHGCLVEEGRYYFYLMCQLHGITPSMKHYACMVDLLSRVGRLDEAKELIYGMPFQPSIVVWLAVLSACKIHGHVTLAEHAVENVIRLDPTNVVALVLLSNIYSANGRWDVAAKVRRRLEARGIDWLKYSSTQNQIVTEVR